MSNKHSSAAARIIIALCFIIAIAFVLSLALEARRGKKEAESRITTITKELSRNLNVNELGSDAFVDTFLESVGDMSDIASFSLSRGTEDIISYPSQIVAQQAVSSPFIHPASTNMNSRDGSPLVFSIAVYTLKPSSIFYKGRIAFLASLCLTLFCLFCIIYAHLEGSPGKDTGSADDSPDVPEPEEFNLPDPEPEESEEFFAPDEERLSEGEADTGFTLLHEDKEAEDAQTVIAGEPPAADAPQEEAEPLVTAAPAEEPFRPAGDTYSEDGTARASLGSAPNSSATDTYSDDDDSDIDFDGIELTLDEEDNLDEGNATDRQADSSAPEPENNATESPAAAESEPDYPQLADAEQTPAQDDTSAAADDSVAATPETPSSAIPEEVESLPEESAAEEAALLAGDTTVQETEPFAPAAGESDAAQIPDAELAPAQDDVPAATDNTEPAAPEEPAQEAESLPEESAAAAEEAPASQQGLFSPKTGFSWETFMIPRLDSELIRSASGSTDLALFTIRIENLDWASDAGKEISALLLQTGKFPDLLFEYGADGCTLIFPDTDIDQSLQSADELYTAISEILERWQETLKIGIGISARSLRMISGSRLANESSEALKHAFADNSSPIVAFKVNPEKYRNYLAAEAAKAEQQQST